MCRGRDSRVASGWRVWAVLVLLAGVAVLALPALGSGAGEAVSGAIAPSAAPAATAATASSGRLLLLWMLAPLGALFGIIGAWVCYSQVMKAPEGDENMRRIAGYVREGARAYLKRQYKVVAIVFGVFFLFFAFLSYVLKTLPALVPFAFLTGGFFSGLSGWIGMNTATRASNRTAQGAKESLDRGLGVAFRSGAVMGLIVVGLALANICVWFVGLRWLSPAVLGIRFTLHETTVILLCSGIGASFQALFARVGGGIFTKAADVGADLVGKVEAGIPEDDPRNPAVIADNVGDNVGDVAGMGADLFESYGGSILASAALGVAAFRSFQGAPAEVENMKFAAVALPMVIAGVGVILSALCVPLVRTKEGATQQQLLSALGRAVNASAIGIGVLSAAVIWIMLPKACFGLWGSVVAGLLTGIVIGKATEYFTSADFKPTQGVAASSNTGPATVIIEGLATGMMSTWVPVISVCVGTLAAYLLAGGADHAEMGLYGVGIAAVGMLSTTDEVDIVTAATRYAAGELPNLAGRLHEGHGEHHHGGPGGR